MTETIEENNESGKQKKISKEMKRKSKVMIRKPTLQILQACVKCTTELGYYQQKPSPKCASLSDTDL